MFKKNTAVTGFPLSLVSKTDGSAITTGTPSGFYLLDGGTQGSIAGSFVHEGNGQWSVNLLAAEMNGDIVGLLFTHTSAVPVHFTIRTTTKLVSDLQDFASSVITALLPTALVSGRMDASVGAIAANAITATSINADAITAAKIADGAIDAATFAAGAINAAAIATDAITAAKIAADAIGASELAADAVTEIQSGLSTLNAAGIRTAIGLASANLDTQLDALPTNTELTTALGTADDATLAAIAALSIPSAAVVADAVWDETLSGHLGAGSTGNALNAAGGSGDPWATAIPGAYGAGTAGKILGDNINATISSRATPAQVNVEVDTAIADAGLATATSLTTVAGNIDTDFETLFTDVGDLATAVAGVSSPSATAIADAVLSRGVSNVEDTADTTSLAALILATFESSVAGTVWTIRKTGGSTFVVKTVTIDAAADPVVGVT